MPSPTSNKVVVATDLSDASLPAIEAAVVEASRRKAELIALSALDLAYPLASGVEPGIVIDEDTTKLLHESCHQALGAAVERFGGKAKTEVVEGPPARAVIAAAERLGAELLVVGTRGRTGLARLALGSVAGRIVSRAHCSVLVVRAR